MAYWQDAFSGRPFNLRLTVSEYALSEDDIANNRSRVSWSLRMYRTGNYNSYSASGNTYSVSLNGSTVSSGSFTYDFGAGPGPEIPIGSYITIASGTRTINHNADGSKTMSVAASASGGPAGSASLSSSMTLTKVPRATTPVLSDAAPDTGETVTITLEPATPDFSHRLFWAFQPGTGGTALSNKIHGLAGGGGSATGTPEGASDNGTAGNYWGVPAGDTAPTITIPHEVFEQATDVGSRTVTLTVQTYDDATLIGTKTVDLVVTLAATEKPTIAGISHSEATTSPDVAALIGGYVQSVSKLALALISPAGIHGSTIVSRQITVAGQILTADGTTPVPIGTSGTVTISATVTDSRGRVSDVVTQDVTVLAYTPPQFATAPVVVRALSDGTTDENAGTYLKVDPADFSAASLVVAGTQKNKIEYRLSYRLAGAGSWTVDGTGWIDPPDTPSGIRFTGTALSTFGSAAVGSAYEVLIEIRDALMTSALQRLVPKAAVLLHLKGAIGVAIGARHSGASNVLEVWGRGKQASDSLTLRDILDLGDAASDAETIAGTLTTKFVTPASAAAERSGKYRYGGTVLYTSSGTFSKASFPGLKAVFVRATGSGAGGLTSNVNGRGHGGGGAGATAEKFIPVDDLAPSETVTVPAGGAGGSTPSAGGDASFGSHCVAGGGQLAVTVTGGLGGTATAGDFLIPGGDGGSGGTGAGGGAGGASFYGGGGAGGYLSGSGNIDGAAGRVYGSGGGGSYRTSGSCLGGAGAQGIVVVELWY